MRVGLIDVDGHHFPNLALMRISAYHKGKGDAVEWWSDTGWYDLVYMSKVFSTEYSPDKPEPMNAGRVIKGGTGYAIFLNPEGREVFDRDCHRDLPPEIESCFPDYSIYPQYGFAVAMTSRGCPRQCSFCHVAPKEGCRSIKVADVADFWNGQKEIKVLDPNLTACRDKRDLMAQYRETGAWIDFTQGLDIRLMNDMDLVDLNAMRIKRLHFAWDNPKDDLVVPLKWFADGWRIKDRRRKTVYILTNYDSTTEQDLHRIYTVRDLGYTPYVMVYDKPNAPKEARQIQRWCNSFRIIQKGPDYYKYRQGGKTQCLKSK